MARARKADLPARQADEIMSAEELAQYLGCHLITLYRLIRTAKIPAFKLVKHWRFRRSEIDRWIAERHVKPGKAQHIR